MDPGVQAHRTAHAGEKRAGISAYGAPAARQRAGMNVALSAIMRIRLLVVEDEPSTVFAMREFFGQAGYEVDSASELEGAAALLEAHVYEAVITDLHLTKLRQGEGMLVASHARRRNPQACIVMLTGYGNEATEERAQRCGVDMYQTKPVALPHLRAFVNLVLGREADGAPAAEGDPTWPRH